MGNIGKVDDAAFDESRLEYKQRVCLGVCRESFCERNRITGVIGYRSGAVERFGNAFSRSPFRSLFSQRIFHNAIIAFCPANLMTQLGILRDGHSLKLCDEQVLCLTELLL